MAVLPAAQPIVASGRHYLAALVPLLALNLTFSRSLHPGLVVLSELVVLAVLGVALAALSRSGGKAVLAWSAALAGSVSALVAVWQGTWGFALQARAVAASDLPMREEALARLGSGRVFGTFLLPASLGGGLAITMPVTIALFVSARGPRARLAVGAAILVQAAAFLWTLSFGAWISLVVAVVVVLGPRLAPTARGRGRLAATAALGILLVALGIAVRKGILPAPGPVDSPLAYRAGNWSAALRMAADNAIFGTGFGTFGTVYPSYRREGMNESRFAHSTWLQLPAELGLGAVPILLLTVLAGVALARRGPRAGALGAAGAIGAVAFLVQNAADFTFYQPSVVALFSLAVALATAPGAPIAGASAGLASPGEGRGEGGPSRDEPGTRRGTSRGIAAGLLIAASGAAVVLLASALSDLARERAMDVRDSDPAAERRALTLATRFDPLDPDARSELARVLAESQSEAGALGRALAQAEAAVALDAWTPYRWWDLATLRIREGRPAAAWVSASKAARLYPMKSEYQRALGELDATLFGPKNGQTAR